ncbi:MAG: glycoside hydrolase family 13 protein [Saprospiraceae bacterium]|nr:glycoside hydrolase family 13 protein [Saprospiraceae bacterium]
MIRSISLSAIVMTTACILFSITESSCKNFVGNPHPTPLPPRVVPITNADLRVEPANWWSGMKHNQVEILFQRADLASYQVKLGKTDGVKLLKVEKGDSPNYLFITLEITPKAPAQKVPIVFGKGENTFTHEYPILARNRSVKAQGVTCHDVIYLIFPDRFANGDPSNDNVPGMLEGLQRHELTGRHGGDLKGIKDHLDYIQDLGITAIWLNPELENDQLEASYHGYAVTDHYRVDRRFGTNEQLRDLVNECHKRNIKVVRDVVLNHIGDNHYWMKDLPTKDWVNQWPTYTKTNYRAPTLLDPYASEYDKKLFSDGWFDRRMPDLNQRNPHVANYLIQQALWWIEWAGLDDLRIDTYPYSDQTFCTRWVTTILNEYPNLGMFGEAWEHAVPVVGYFADDQPMRRANFDSNLPGIIDFQLCFAVREALVKSEGWSDGVAKIYYTLAQDYFYKDPYRNQIMLDNHDMTRIFSHVGENLDKFKIGMAFLLTMRGIPQIYYATEILDTGFEAPSHGNIRKDFPGGWPGDAANKFTAEGRTAAENDAFNFTRTLIRYRNATPALQTGKLMQFVPEDGVYVYFRYDAEKTVMVALNFSEKEVRLATARFAERMQGFSKAKNVATGEVMSDISTLAVGKHGVLVLEMGR